MAGFYRTRVIDGVLARSPAEHVRRPRAPTESPTLGLTHLQFEAMLTAARGSSNLNDFAPVAMLGLLGLRIFEATGADITELSHIHGHRVQHDQGKGDKIVDVPLPPAVGRAIDRAVAGRTGGPILRSITGNRMDRHCATRRLRALATTAGVAALRMHPHMLHRTYVTTMLDAGVDLRDVQIAARHADPRTTMRYDRARNNLDRHANYILAAFTAARDLKPHPAVLPRLRPTGPSYRFRNAPRAHQSNAGPPAITAAVEKTSPMLQNFHNSLAARPY
jgi:integrase